MQNRRKLPIGLDNFEKLRNNDFYYVDKRKLIQLLMESGEKVNHVTRPNRFGKTQNMSICRTMGAAIFGSTALQKKKKDVK